MHRAGVFTILLLLGSSLHAAGIGVDDRSRAEISIKVRIATRVWARTNDKQLGPSNWASGHLCVGSSTPLARFSLALAPASKAVSGDASAWREVKAVDENAVLCETGMGSLPVPSDASRPLDEPMILLVSPQ